jgi:glutamate synthase (NADPH/NADH) large chain
LRARGSRSTSCRRPRRLIASDVPLLDRQQAFGYTQEDLRIILAPMAESGEEAVGSMGNDAALPVLSHRPKTLYSYFKQLFAQVTNPPIDPIREELVMSLVTFIGPRPNLPRHRRHQSRDAARSDAADPHQRRDGEDPPHRAFHRRRVQVVRARHLLPAAWGANGMEAALASLSAQAEDAIHLGYNILIVSDRKVSADLMPIPALPRDRRRCISTWLRNGLRTSTGLVVETGLGARGPPLRAARGLRRRGDPPYLALEDARHARRHGCGSGAARIGEALPEGDQQGDSTR